MNQVFNANEVFEMAEEIERNGAAFYRAHAEAAYDKPVKKLLLDLAAMEDDHEKIFSEMRKALSAPDKGFYDMIPESEPALYLQSLADVRVFFEKNMPATPSVIDVLKSAIQAEKDSIVFYLGLKDMVPLDLGRDKIEGIIKEEMKHIHMLSVALKENR